MTTQRDEIPSELLAFLHSCIDSVEQLQILLLLSRDNSYRTVEEISRELRSTPASVQKRLQDLKMRNVLADNAFGEKGAIRLSASSPEVAKTILALATLYRQRPHRVIAQIFANPPAPLQSFAESFKIKRKENQ